MQYIEIKGMSVPVLGFGTWKLAGGDAVRAIGQSFEAGYRHIDTAQAYENEADVGEAVATSGLPREEIFLTTKVWMNNVRDGDLQKSVAQSLKKLKTGYVDLLLIHWPVADVPFTDQMKALMDMKKEGMARMIGVSNFTVAQLRRVVEAIGAPVVANQVEYHPFLSQAPVLDYLRAQGMFLTAYSPLARGAVNDDPVIIQIAQKYGKTPGQVTLRWLVQQGDVVAIPKAGSQNHIRDNINIFDFALTAEEMDRIHKLARADGRLINPAWAPEWDIAKPDSKAA